MVIDNDNNNNDASPKLSYEISQEKALCFSTAAKNQTNMRSNQGNLISNTCSQHVSAEYSNSNSTYGSTMQNDENTFISIPLLYDSDMPTDPEVWDGSFHPISLHGLIKHIASDAKNIKDSLKFMAKYISNKQVKPAKANNLDNFNDIREVVWNFISSVYNAN